MLKLLLFFSLILSIVIVFIWGLKEKERLYSFPFLITLVYIGFIIPQVIGLLNEEHVPESGLNLFLIISELSLLMCYLGWNVKIKREISLFEWELSITRLKIAATIFTFIGSLFYYLLTTLPPYMIEVSQWTGLPVAYLFFAHLLVYGLTISVFLFLRERSIYALLLIILGLIFYLNHALLQVRRSDTIELFAILLILYWFINKKIAPRYLFIIFFLLGIFIFYSTGDVRNTESYIYGYKFEDFLKIDYKGNIDEVLTHGGAEVTNAVMEIAATQLSGNYDYGLYHWNMLIFNYVPAQLFSAEFKESLYLNLDYEEAHKYFRYFIPLGSTQTGFVDAFKSFGLFGILKFFVIAFILGSIYRKGMKNYSVYQLLYCLLITPSLLTVTHNTQWFIIPIIHMSIFLFPVLYFARIPSSKIK